jgi:hypothetical protein
MPSEVSPLWRGVHLAVLWAFAVVQPLLDLLGGNAEFFVARGNPSGDVVVLALALALLPPLALLGLETLAGLASRRLEWLLHLGFVALLAAAFALLVLDGILDGRGWLLVGAALVLGGLTGVLYARSAEARSLLNFLAPAPVVFVVLFLFFSDASKVVLPEDDADALAAGSTKRPIVVLQLDELATASLMDRERTIAERRFPNFAALARQATWYRNATTVADHTDDAVPAILTGVRPDASLDPLASDHPNNLFTLFAGSMRLNVHEYTVRLCPEAFCEAEAGSFAERMKALASDLGVVTAHLVLPDSLTTGLPPVNEGFSGFTAPEAGDEDLPHVGIDQEAIGALLNGIEQTPRSLHYIHLSLPHVPWRYLPDGRDYVHGEVWREFDDSVERWPADGRWVARQGLRAHLLQTGYADALLGGVMRNVRESGAWDEALIVVLADHGVSFVPGTSRRYAEAENIGEIAPMPLFIKEPGQHSGRVDQRPVTTIDVLPTIAELAGVELPFEVDGKPASQVHGNAPLKVLRGDEDEPRTFDAGAALRGIDVAAARIQRLFGSGWEGVWRMGPHSELIGKPVKALDSAPADSGATFALSRADGYADVDTEATFVPALVSGRLEGVAAGAPLAVAVNGRIAAVSEAYDSVSGGVHVAALVPPASFRDGPNDVQLYAAVGRAGGLSLQPLGGT